MKMFWGKKQSTKPAKIVSQFKSSYSLAERIEKRTVFKAKYPDSDFSVAVIEGLAQLPAHKKNIKPYLL